MNSLVGIFEELIKNKATRGMDQSRNQNLYNVRRGKNPFINSVWLWIGEYVLFDACLNAPEIVYL